MQQLKAIKVRIYPTKAQENQLAQFFGAKRFIFNYFLSEQKRRFATKEKHLSNFDINKEITKMRHNEETAWLADMDSILLQQTAEDLSTAYDNFFKSISGKRKGKKMELPKYKKKSSRQSYRTRGIKITEQGLKLPKIKTYINVVLDRPITGKIKSATISKTPSGKYFVSILVETEVDLKPMSGRGVGIDLGLKDLAILSDGIKFQHPEKLLAKT